VSYNREPTLEHVTSLMLVCRVQPISQTFALCSLSSIEKCWFGGRSWHLECFWNFLKWDYLSSAVF